MEITDILGEDDISLDLTTKGKHSALSKVALEIARGIGCSERTVLAGLLRREHLGSTGVGHGVAVPHALLDVVSSPVASLTRLAVPIGFGSPDGDPVDLLFTLIWPLSDTQAFLPAFASVCRVLRSSWLRDGLRQARSSDEAMALLRMVEDKSTSLRTAHYDIRNVSAFAPANPE
ncbi:PTS sugar transporter subunit IIA [Mesorhizobium sp. A623]